LIEELALTKKRGYAIDLKEHESKTICFGVPIFDHNGDVIAAVSLSDIVSSSKDYDAIIRDLIKCGKQISKAFGFTSPYFEDDVFVS